MVRKFICLALMIALLTCVCVGDSEHQYKYADRWNLEEHTYNEDIAQDILSMDSATLCANSEVDSTELAPFKEAITEHFKGYDFDWGNFTKVNTVRRISASFDNISEPTIMALALHGVRAVYDGISKQIFLSPSISIVDERSFQQLIYHELMHSLFSTRASSRIEEGLADYYVCQLFEALGETGVEPSYREEVLAVKWLMAVYDEETVLKVVRSGTYDKLIDDAVAPGMYNKFDQAILATRYPWQYKLDVATAANTWLEILAYTAASQGKGKAVEGLLDYAATTLYGDQSIRIDTEYLKQILS